MHRTATAVAATALAATGITVLATSATAETPAPSPTAIPTWTVVHPTYIRDADVPPPAPSPTPERTTYAPEWILALPAAAAPAKATGVPAPAVQRWRPRTTIAPATSTPARRHRAGRPRPTRIVRHHAVHHRAPARGTYTTSGAHPHTYRAGSGKWRIVEGETLSGIARIFDVTVDQLARANGIADPDRIYAGQWLAIPAGGR